MKTTTTYRHRYYLLTLIFFFFYASTFAQDRILTGPITDADTDAPFIGANIIVQGTTQGIVSNTDGKYQLSVPEGEATVVVLYEGS